MLTDFVLCVADGLPSDEEDFFDALDHQVEQEFEVALPHNKDKLHRWVVQCVCVCVVVVSH